MNRSHENKLNFVALSITTKCSHNCKFCYITEEGAPRFDGDVGTLYEIGDELVRAGVETVELVGGDPAAHRHVAEIIRHFHNLGLEVAILSNTHEYANSSIEKIAPYVSALEVTLHGGPEAHDAQTLSGAYDRVIGNLQRFDKVRTADQQIGVTLNFTPETCKHIFDIVNIANRRVPVDYVQIQRVGPFGRAKDLDVKMKLKDIITAYDGIRRVNEELGIRMDVVDSYPLCLIPRDYHQYVARCDWGHGTAYIDQEGTLSRCAVNEIALGNILDAATPLADIWENHPSLKLFRSKEYLRDECKSCALLEQCGGGCPVSCGGCDLSTDELLGRYHSMWKQ